MALVPVHGQASLKFMDGLLDFTSMPVFFFLQDFGVGNRHNVAGFEAVFPNCCRLVQFSVLEL